MDALIDARIYNDAALECQVHILSLTGDETCILPRTCSYTEQIGDF